ncbi:F-box only protein 36-like [Nematostella vectensis]|uniref:F-box only protein 36-like n=1 Tax=Nematostella vectensis TaxID=45351 RepID=UPI00138FC70A|nr:F-box only protein 36-like [Nematostella vectensis]
MSKGIIYVEKAGQAPAPSKDFHQIVVNETEVIWRTWRIAVRREQRAVPPSTKKVLWAEFDQDELLQSDIHRVFGEEMLRLVHGIACGDWLVRLPPKVVVRLCAFLHLIDVVRLSTLNRYLNNICSSDEVWTRIIKQQCPDITTEMKNMAKDLGWKKTFFANKLHHQVASRKLREEAKKHIVYY